MLRFSSETFCDYHLKLHVKLLPNVKICQGDLCPGQGKVRELFFKILV